MEKQKIYTFGIKDNRGKWNYLTSKYKLNSMDLTEAYYDNKSNIENAAEFVMKYLESSEFNLDSASLFEMTIKTLPFNTNKLVK